MGEKPVRRNQSAAAKPTIRYACGGNPWASTFLDSVRYLDQLGRLAKRGVQVVFPNTLASRDYGLLDQSTFLRHPDYWAALLWRKLMGPIVLDPGPSQPSLRLYAQCLRDHPGGVSVLAINTSRSKPAAFELAIPAERYTLTAQRLEDRGIRLNGHQLDLGPNDELPSLQGTHTAAGQVKLAPASINFIAFADARNGSCQ